VAQRFFGASAPEAMLGQTFTATINGTSRDFQVAAIYRLPEGNSVLNLPMLTQLDMATLPAAYDSWTVLVMHSYVQLRHGVRPDMLTAGLDGFAEQNAILPAVASGSPVAGRMRFELQNIAAVHLNSPFDSSRAGGNAVVVMAFTALAVLVLLIGTINFTILSTARATRRARETALRKTIGASRSELIGQFLGESFAVALPAMLVACVLVELLLPVFEAMVGKTLQISWFAPGTALALGGLYVAVSVLGGLYPAFVLSQFRPAATLRAGRLREGSDVLSVRNLLVVFQFAVSIALIVATSVILLQVRYAMNRDPGFDRNNLIVIEGFRERPDVRANKQALKTQLLAVDGVTSAAFSSHQPTQTGGEALVTGAYFAPGSEATPQAIATLSIEPGFFSTYRTQIVAGREFSAELDQPGEIFVPPSTPRNAVPVKVVINESASRQLGFASPSAAVNTIIRTSRTPDDLLIIGVASDTNFFSMNALPRAEIYSFSPLGPVNVLTLRFDGDSQAVMNQVSEVWREVMGDAVLYSSFVAQKLEAEFAQEKVEAQLMVSFSALAVLIACLGLYGSASFTVERRTKEVGIRKVLGAEVRELLALLLWQFSKPVLIANVIAWPVAMWAMLRWLQRFPYQIDYVLLVPLCVMAGALALSIAWLTVASNTLRVATAKPVLALRYE
jgi:putative ABC transport system permease protein